MKPFPTALPPISGEVFSLTGDILEAGLTAARQSPRKRIIQPIQRTQDAVVQRMLNFLLPGTNLRPHLHPREHAVETIQVLQGELGFIIFEEDGTVREAHRLSADGFGLIDIEPKVWHTSVALAPDTVILEIKCGPYDVKTDKVFAEWAPAEDEPGADAFRESTERLFD